MQVNEASQVEIQAFGMINDESGSRLVEEGETPAYFDVTVSTAPLKGGEILIIEERENMTAWDAAKVLAEMAATYPSASISCVNCDLGVDHGPT